MHSTASLTGKYLNGELRVPPPKEAAGSPARRRSSLKGASRHNLKNVDIEIPIGLTTCITGVSGSGKSTLVHECLFEALRCAHARGRARRKARAGSKAARNGLPTPCSWTRAPSDGHRARTPSPTSRHSTTSAKFLPPRARRRASGLNSGSFSFNIPGGRCEICQGDGTVTVEMQFLADVELVCEECKGMRYKSAVLDILYKGKNIYQVLQMTVREALAFFNSVPKITKKLKVLDEVGLGYLRLGQSATTLSGGEAQRIKLAAYLAREVSEKTLFIFDEPTTGLHFDDINKLLVAFRRLIEAGGTVLIIEHNLDIIKCADWVIDLGPEGGDGGGRVVALGTPEEIAGNPESLTGQFLRKVLTGI